MKKFLLMILILCPCTISARSVNYQALMNALSRLNVAAVEYELRQGMLSKEAKKQLLEVVDELIKREEKNNEWHHNHVALLQCGCGLVTSFMALNLYMTHKKNGVFGFLAGIGLSTLIVGLAKFFSHASSYVNILAIKACILKNTESHE